MCKNLTGCSKSSPEYLRDDELHIYAQGSEIKHSTSTYMYAVWVLTHLCPRGVCGMLLYAQTFIDKEN